MQGKIIEHGILSIKRGSFFKQQRCKCRETTYCADRCPLFGEPIILKHVGEASLRICEGRTLLFKGFTDERK